MRELVVHNSWFKPKFKFFNTSGILNKPSKNKLYLGIELEVNFKNEHNRTNALNHRDVVKPWWYAVEDHSLKEWGVELVTHPISWEWFEQNRYELFRAVEAIKECGGTVNKDCGLHIHLNRSAFVENHLIKFQRLIYNYPLVTIKIARRPEYTINKWAKLNETNQEIIRKTKLKMAVNAEDKNKAVNLCHRNTIEIRIFKSSLAPSDIFASAEYCKSLYEYTKDRMKPTFRGLRSWCNRNERSVPHLVDLLDKRLPND